MDTMSVWVILAPFLVMVSIIFIVFGIFAIVRKLMAPSYANTGSWTSPIIHLVFGNALFFAGITTMRSQMTKNDDDSSSGASSDTASSSAAPSSTTPPSETAPSNTAIPSPEPTHTPAPEPREPLNIPWDIIGLVIVVLIALCLVGFIVSRLVRKITSARNTRITLQREIQHVRDTHAATLRKIMAAFTAESTNPVNTLKYPLYRAADHPINRAYVNAMMAAYNEQDALDAAIAQYFKRKPEMISTKHFEDAVSKTAQCWDTLNYEAKKIGSPLISFTTQRKANNLLKRALDEDNYAAEREAAMSRLIQLLEDARSDLKANNDDNAVLVDVMLDALTDAQRNGNTLLAPDALRELTAVADTATQQNLNLPALTA